MGVSFLNKESLMTKTVAVLLIFTLSALAHATEPATQTSDSYTLDFDSPVDPKLQAALENIDTSLCEKFSMTSDQTAVGLLDLNSLRLAMIRPDHEEYR